MKYFLAILFILTATTVCAQKMFTVTGTVQDKDKQVVEGATIRLLSLNDSTFIRGGITDKNGRFSLTISVKESLMEISFMGYKTKYKHISFAKAKTLKLDTLTLAENDIRLNEVVIKGEAPAISIKGDTLEYNSGSYKVPENATVKDLLKALPNVVIDEKGGITVQGKKVSRIMIDGKNFFSGDPDLAGKSLPADLVNKVQVFEKNSESADMTGFEDEKKETVINLTVKEEMKVSMFTRASGGVGHDIKSSGKTRYTSNATINAMLGKDQYSAYFSKENAQSSMWSGMGGENENTNFGLNINKDFSKTFNYYGNISFSDMNSQSDNLSETETFVTDTDKLFEKTKDINNNLSKQLGYHSRMLWNINKKNKFVTNINFSYNKGNGMNISQFDNLNAKADTLYNGYSRRKDRNNGINLQVNLDYAYHFKKKGRVFSTSINNSINNDGSQDFYNWKQRLFEDGVYNRDSLINQRSEGDNRSYQFQGQLSFVEPIKKDYFVQALYNLSLSDGNNIRSAYNFFDPLTYPDSIILNPLQSRSTERNVTTQRFALNFRAKKKKYNYTLGFNVDINNSVNNTWQPSTNETERYRLIVEGRHLPNEIGDSLVSSIKQHTMNFSPIFNLNYKFSEQQTFRINYNGYINQPSANQLQDFVDMSNPTNSIKGNPDLKANFMNNVSTTYNIFNKKTYLYAYIRASARFSFNDIQNDVTINPETGYRMTTYKNVNGNWSSTLNGTFNMPLKNKKFSVGNSIYSSFTQSKTLLNGNTNTMHQLHIQTTPQFNYNGDKLQARFRGLFIYAATDNKNQPESNTKMFDWGLNTSITYELPLKIQIESTVNWIQKSGYGKGYNYSEVLWNASLSRNVFSTKKAGSGRLSIAVDDILQAKRNLTRTVSNSYIMTRRSNIPGSYFMCSFTYNFSMFPGGKGGFMSPAVQTFTL